MLIMLCIAIVMIVALIATTVKFRAKAILFKSRLEKKDRIIAYLIRALPTLFVENYKDPNPMKKRDGSFVFYVQTRPEYDGKFISIKWICEGVNKTRYNSLILKYFYYLESLGIEVHPTLLGDKPYSGRVMIESYHDMEEDELQNNDLFS